LADEIISTGRVMNETSTADQILELVNSMFNQNKNQKMDLIKNHFGLDAKADETSILNKIKEKETILADVQNKVSELETEKTALQEKNAELETKIQEQNDAVAVESVENAIKNGLIEESSKDQMIEVAKNNLDTFKTILKSVKRTPVRVTNTVQTNNGGKNVSLREMEKNNPKEVQRILNEEPETYKQMYFEQYGVEPTV
jgi:chromosome segregation ATPase